MQSQFLHYLRSKNPTFINYLKLSAVWPLILNESSKLMCVVLIHSFPWFLIKSYSTNNPPFLHEKTNILLYIHHTDQKTCSVKTWENCHSSTAASKLSEGIKHSNTILLLIKAGKYSNSTTSLSITPHLDIFVWWSLLPFVLGSKMFKYTYLAPLFLSTSTVSSTKYRSLT